MRVLLLLPFTALLAVKLVATEGWLRASIGFAVALAALKVVVWLMDGGVFYLRLSREVRKRGQS